MDDEYYFAFCPNDKTGTRIRPDARTARRRYRTNRLLSGAPLRFLEMPPTDRSKGQPHPGDILFNSPFLLAKEWIKEEISRYPLRTCQMVPAIFVDSTHQEHTEYWFTNCWEPLSALDRERSEVYDLKARFEEMGIQPDPEEDDEEALVKSYGLSHEVLAAIPLNERIIFLLGGVAAPRLVIHEHLVSYIQKQGAIGVRFFRISEFVEGMQHR